MKLCYNINNKGGKNMLLGKFLVGSNNYNLDLPESDKDYKGVVMPNFTDLYFNKTLNAQIDEHKSLVDYRFFCQKLAKDQ